MHNQALIEVDYFAWDRNVPKIDWSFRESKASKNHFAQDYNKLEPEI